MKGNKVLHSSASDEWSTPQDFFDILDKEFEFDVDGAATNENKKCPEYCTDYLNFKASPCKVIWLNPPYSMCAEFMKKSWELAMEGHVIVCLIPARTDTKYWHEYCSRACEIRFLKGRLKFGNSTNSAPFPSAVVIFNGVQPLVVKHWDWKKDL